MSNSPKGGGSLRSPSTVRTLVFAVAARCRDDELEVRVARLELRFGLFSPVVDPGGPAVIGARNRDADGDFFVLCGGQGKEAENSETKNSETSS